MIYYTYKIVPREEGFKMRTININIKDEFTIYGFDEYHMVEEIMMRMVDQLIDQGVSEETIREGIEFSLDNIFGE